MIWLDQLFQIPDDVTLIYGDFQPWLVALSVFVAMFASFIALQVTAQARFTRDGIRKRLILLAGSCALGGGIWSMHFIGMLAFNLHTPINYAAGLTGLSMVPSIAASWVALNLIVKESIRVAQLSLGGVVVGAGIGIMHYSGMAAMQMLPMLRYDPALFALSILVAVSLAILALWIRFGIDRFERFNHSELQLNLMSGVIMGAAISGMHYTGMTAAQFVLPEGMVLIGDSGEPPQVLALAVSIITIAITSLVLAINLIFRYRDVSMLAQHNEKSLRSIMDTAVDGIMTINGSGKVIGANPAVQMIFGWEPQELVGNSVNVLMPEPHRSQHDSYISEFLRTGEAKIIGIEREVEALHRNGNLIPIRIAVGHVQLSNEDLFVAFVSDISQRIKMENDLRLAKKKAEQAAMARQTFLANMSHEIRTPMNAIIGFSDILLETHLDEEQRKYLLTISKSSRSLLHLLDEILDSSKLEKGKIELNNIDFSLTEEVDHVISTLWVQASKRGLDLELKVSRELAPVYHGPPDRIRQVLINLVNNAIKFTESGKVTVEITPVDDDKILFIVSDTGIGIPADRLDNIFEPFTQSDSSMNRRFGGTGLGTTISKQLVELMGGTISVSSELEVGTTFSFCIPLSKGKNPEPGKLPETIKLPNMSILVADDIKQNVMLLTVLLSRDGHSVTSASNGEQAIEQYEKVMPDIILMDVQMPGMDGLTAARKIRELEASNGSGPIPIVALTASVLEQDRIAAKEAGMDGFSSKPVDSQLLYLEIARVLKLDIEKLSSSKQRISVDTPLFNKIKGIQLWGSLDTYLSELNKFIEEQRSVIHKIQKTIDASDWATLRDDSHKFKSLCGNLALSSLMRLFGQLENHGREERSENLTELVNNIHSEFARLELEFASLIDTEEKKPEENPASTAVLNDLLNRLLLAAQANEHDEVALQTLSDCSSPEYRLFVDRVSAAFNDFEFDRAKMLLSQFMKKIE